jgi:hypothetical protein
VKPETTKRGIHSNRLLQDLLLSGRQLVCEVSGCGCIDPTELQIHHILPVTIQPVHAVHNLAILCQNHHALVERFYWWERSQLMPEILFHHRQVPFKALDWYKTRTVELWDRLNNHEQVKNFMWWRAVFARAKTWASSQEVVRRVDPKDAIVEEPWFRTREVQNLEAARM